MRITFFLFVAIATLSVLEPARAAQVNVIAADIISVDAKEWRIANVEAPQMDSSCAEEKAFAVVARAKLAEILASGNPEVLPTGGHDMQQRDTALVHINGRDVGEQMVAARMALRRGHGRPFCFAMVVDATTGAEPGRSVSHDGVGISRGQARPAPLPPRVGMPR